jgi:hypothetical protein
MDDAQLRAPWPVNCTNQSAAPRRRPRRRVQSRPAWSSSLARRAMLASAVARDPDDWLVDAGVRSPQWWWSVKKSSSSASRVTPGRSSPASPERRRP